MYLKNINEYLNLGIFILFFVFLSFQFPVALQAQDVENEEIIFLSRNKKVVPASEDEKSDLYLAVKTNLLYDAALLPNLSVEWYIGKQWSLAVEGNWSWWTLDRHRANQWVHRIQAGGLEIRRWFSSPVPLQGHAIGLYSLAGNYDVRLFTRDASTTGWLSYQSWSGGLSYAYSFPIARRFNLEFGLAVGYVGGRYYEYDYYTGGVYEDHWQPLAIKNRHYFGPTRLGISLVWLLNPN